MIRNIIFDLNKVIVTYENHPQNEELDKRYMELIGMTQEEFWKGAMKHFDEYNEGRINFEEYMKIVFDQFNLPYSKISELRRIHDESFRFVEGFPQILDELKQSHNLILLAGDGFECGQMKVETFQLKKYFNNIYITSYEKTNKKTPGIYQKILRENSLNAAETLFIDDLTEHIEAANKAGINTIQFKDINQLARELSRFGINLKKHT
ncbi:MAG: HAD family hydrolase [Nanoarchaeota archaeon]